MKPKNNWQRSLTRREKIALIIAAFFAFAFIFIPQQILDGWEVLILLLVVFPIGIYIATDPDRMKKKGE